MEGLLGLTKSINSSESAVRDLSILERMDNRIQQDKQAEIQAQQQEQLMYERAYQMSDQLLEKDRARINARIKMAQSQVTDYMRLNGGSRKRFMEQGGLSVLNGITNDIMRSDEAITYQENKKNLAKILEAKEKGLGHLLSPRDLKSLEEYENSEQGGKITYSGIMAEVEIPPSANFDFGTDIPLEKILSHGSNMMKIKANFEATYPNKEPNYQNIYAFAKEMGYGGMGSNTTRMREETLRQQAIAKAKAESPLKEKPNSFITNFNEFKANGIPAGLNMAMLLDKEKYPDGLIETIKKGQNPSANKLLGNKNTLTSRGRSLSEEGFDWTDIRNDKGKSQTWWESAFNEKYGLAESYEFMPMSKNQIVDRVFGEQGEKYKIENNEILDFLPTQDMYRMDGVQLNASNKLDPDDHKGNYKVEGVFTALRGKGPDGNVLITNAYNDDDTTLDEKQTKINNEGYLGKNGGDNLAFTTVIALKNANGDLFYKEIDMSRPDIAQALSNAIGDDDNIQPQVDQENRMHAQRQQLEALSAEEEIQLRGTINTLDKTVFTEGVFESEGSQYYGANSAGQLNRYPLMKSFYIAFDFVNNSYRRDEMFPQGDRSVRKETIQKAVDNHYFSTFAEIGGIQDDLKSYEQGNSNDKIINKWLYNVNKDLEKGTTPYNANQEIAMKWRQMLELQKK